MYASEPTKLFYLPNESPADLQVGPRQAFQELQRQGRISRLDVFSFLHKRRQLGHPAACCELLAAVEAGHPDIIFWQHAGDFDLSEEFLLRLKKIAPRSLLVYHEGDTFSRFYKRYPRSTRAMLRQADVVFQVGLGALQRLAENCGARRIYWVPHVFDCQRVGGSPPPPGRSRPYSAVMIGNLIRFGNLIPPACFVSRYPGGWQRLQLARRLTGLLGDRFAVYGNSWVALPSVRGPLPFAEQSRVIQQSWVSANWDHFPGHSYYFSDRLPIALACGVPHVTNDHPGYDVVLRGCPGLVLAHSVQDAVDGVLYFLSLSRERNLELGAEARQFAYRHFEAGVVFTGLFDKCLEILEERRRLESYARSAHAAA